MKSCENIYCKLIHKGYGLNEIDEMDLFYYLYLVSLEVKKDKKVVYINQVPGL